MRFPRSATVPASLMHTAFDICGTGRIKNGDRALFVAHKAVLVLSRALGYVTGDRSRVVYAGWQRLVARRRPLCVKATYDSMLIAHEAMI